VYCREYFYWMKSSVVHEVEIGSHIVFLLGAIRKRIKFYGFFKFNFNVRHYFT